MHCKQLRAKKGNEPPKGRTCPSRCSECPSPMDRIPLAVAAAPPGVHRLTSLRPRLPSGRAQRFKCHQSAAQRFSPYLPHALQANESKRKATNPTASNLSLTQSSQCPSPMDPIPLAVAAAPPEVHRMPSLQPKLPMGRAQRFKCHQSAAQRFSPYLPLVPHSALSARLRWTRFLLQWLQRPLGYTECPHFDPKSPMAQHNVSNATSQQRRGFHPTCHMHCKQMRAKKGNEPPKGRTCPSWCSQCPSTMDPIPLAVAAAPPGVHRMPSLQP